MFCAKTWPRPDATTLLGEMSPVTVRTRCSSPSEFGVGSVVVVVVLLVLDVERSVRPADAVRTLPSPRSLPSPCAATATLTPTTVAASRIAKRDASHQRPERWKVPISRARYSSGLAGSGQARDWRDRVGVRKPRRHEPRSRREAPAPHHRRHARPTRPTQRDVDRAGDRARRRAAARSRTTTTPGWSCSPAPGAAFCSGLDLKDYGVIPNIDGLSVGRIAQRSMRYYSRLIVTLRRMPQPVIAAVNGPAYGGGMCLVARRRLRHRGGVGDVQRDRHRQRAHQHRARRELAAAAPHRRLALERHAAHRPQGRRRRGLPDRARVAGGARRRAGRRGARGGRADVRVQPLRARDDEGHHLGRTSRTRASRRRSRSRTATS